MGIAVIGQRMICLAETMDSSFPREVGARGLGAGLGAVVGTREAMASTGEALAGRC